MHLLITEATPPSPDALEKLAGLALPNLAELAGLLQPEPPQHDVPDQLNTLQEHLHAQALGLKAPDGQLPWAMLLAQEHALVGANQPGWALVTPCHWKVNSDHVEMLPLENLSISDVERSGLFDAMLPYFRDDGIALHALPDGQWLAHGSALMGMRSASAKRVNAGRVDHWLPREQQYRGLRRLQNEMQMLLYTHAVNDARAARGLPDINSFWISGTGEVPAGWQRPANAVTLLNLVSSPLRNPAHSVLQSWLDGWKVADATACAAMLQAARTAQHAPDANLALTLCGAHSAQRFTVQKPSWWSSLRNRVNPPSVAQLFKQL